MNTANQKKKPAKSPKTTRQTTCEYCKETFKNKTVLKQHLKECPGRAQTFKTAFDIWLDCNIATKSKRTYNDFKGTIYFSMLTNFVEKAENLKYQFILEYTKWLYSNGIKMTFWLNPHNYEAFLKTYVNTENPRDAVSRSLELIIEIGYYGRFFKEIPVSQFITYLETGKISPWLIMTYPKINDIIERMTEEQAIWFLSVVNMDRWTVKVGNKYPKTYADLKQILKDKTI